MSERNQSKHSMPGLTGLRGVAAFMVLLFHCWGETGFSPLPIALGKINIQIDLLLSIGWSGVQILFVLSAFLLSRPFIRANSHLKPCPSTQSYLLHRASRVFPAYYAQLLILVIVFYAINGVLPFGLEKVHGYALMLFVPEPLGIGNPNLNGVWWTLPIELSFYLFLPLLAPFLTWKNRFYLLAFFLLCMVIWRYYVVSVLTGINVTGWTLQLPGSMDSFGIGIMAALIHVHYFECLNSRRYLFWLRLAFTLSIPAYMLLVIWMGNEKLLYWKNSLIFFSWTMAFSAVTAVVILACAANLDSARRLLANRYVFYLGLISYGLYLWHFPVMKWLYQYSPISTMAENRFLYLTFTTSILTFLLAAFSWHFIESKVIAWVKHRTDTPEQRTSVNNGLAQQT
ncbi:acyltransferase family protein [Pseudoteredinibacter isoporae]|uniref:acyltransferase family protein n=1 Tax=Pseudoteredinibacter isoporae TaxID=570281 RepID=UPI00333EAD1A